jgi:hypothetical protein
MTDLNAEWAACRPPSPQERANLCRMGIDMAATVTSPGGGLLIADIETSGEHFQFGPPGTGRKALVLACDLAGDELAITDLIAFDPREPTRWRLRLGVANWLAGWELDRRTYGMGWEIVPPVCADGSATFDPLPIWRHPLAWLQGGCKGSVPLTAEATQDLYHVESGVLCEDLVHAEDIERGLLGLRTLPMLKVPATIGRAA